MTRRAEFSESELSYLSEGRKFGRVATADLKGRPQVTPVGMWSYNAGTGTIDIKGRDIAATRKFRNIAKNPQASIVIDDMASIDPWRPRAIMIEGPAEAIAKEALDGPVIRIKPDNIVSWGLEGPAI